TGADARPARGRRGGAVGRDPAAAEGPRLRRMTPRVAIVCATRNQGRWLPATIASVRAQTMADFELVLVDDASTDDSAALAPAARRSSSRATSSPRSSARTA